MARIRSTKPEFWSDLKIARMSRDARLLYIALWNQADEWARVHGDIRWVKGHCFPYDDDLNLAAIERLLTELAGNGRVVRYTVDGDPYLYLPTLGKHQRLEPNKTPSRLPAPPAHSIENFPDESEKFSEQSAPIVVQHVAGSMEHVAGSMKQGEAKPPRSARGTRIPDDFAVTNEMMEWAKQEVPGLDIETATKRFILHFQAASGQKATMISWVAAWKKWMLGDHKPANVRGSPPSRHDENAAAVQRMRQREAEAAQQANPFLEIEAR